jgi:hypothetical protein
MAMSGKEGFRIGDHDIEARLSRLDASQAGELENALAALTRKDARREGEGAGFPHFLLPLAESGLTAGQMIALVGKVPADFPLDHRDIYFDFRLGRWMRHLEPPTLSQCLEEYLGSAETPAEGLAYVKEEWRKFLSRHQVGL